MLIGAAVKPTASVPEIGVLQSGALPAVGSSPVEGQGSTSPAHVDWRSIAIFYAIACLLSWPFFWWRDHDPQGWIAWAVPNVVKAWAPAAGPAIAFWCMSWLLGRSLPPRPTILGNAIVRALIFAAVPAILLMTIGIGSDEPHLTGLWFFFVYVVYALGEEAGWRGFLNEALKPLSAWRRATVVGLLWGTWHFTTFWGGSAGQAGLRLAIMYPLWILASWGLDRATTLTRSLLVAAMLHLLFNFATALPMKMALLVLLPSALMWILLIRTWKPDSARLPAMDSSPQEGTAAK